MITLKEIHEQDKRPPSVTVSMTCYNHEKYLDEAIRGVLMQKTNFPVNIVIHDDASTDRSAEIIRRYASENPNITAIIEETNYVQNGKEFFSKVLPHLTGKYIAYCECDDFWIDENKLQIQVDYLESNPDCVALYSNTLPVNKYSQHDENVRYFPKTNEGDYSHWGIFVLKHQLASLVLRNFWTLMSHEDINTYIKTRANGDEKILALCMHIGRVHYFAQELAAYRNVNDEGDSFSARCARMTRYDLLKFRARWINEIYVMVESLFGKKSSKKYIHVLSCEIASRIVFRRSIIKEINLNTLSSAGNIPLYVWPASVAYGICIAAKEAMRMFLSGKARNYIRRIRLALRHYRR